MYWPEQTYTWYFDEPILKDEVIECCECGQIITRRRNPVGN